jgi:hypothetical protein
MIHWRLMMHRLDHTSPLMISLVSAACCAAGWFVVVLSVLELWP